jgi:RNA-binding protein NOB1
MASLKPETHDTPTMELAPKPVHTIVLDAGPIIKGEPAVSTLLGQCEVLLTTASVIDEIKDKATRTRLETILMPFLAMRTPKPPSIKTVSDFARKIGDLSVLSRTDIELLALSYELECERNQGDWRLRKYPGQRRTNGPSPFKETEMPSVEVQATPDDLLEKPTQAARAEEPRPETPETLEARTDEAKLEIQSQAPAPQETGDSSNDLIAKVTAEAENPSPSADSRDHSSAIQDPPGAEEHLPLEAVMQDLNMNSTSPDSEAKEQDSDSEGWITPSNINRKQLEGSSSNSAKTAEPKIMQVVNLPSYAYRLFAHNDRPQ